MSNLPIILQSVKDVLEGMPGRQAHIKDITKEALAKNVNLNLSADEFENKANAALASHVKRKTDLVFTKVVSKKDKQGNVTYKRGVYRLKTKRGSQAALATPIPPPAGNLFVGKAGEFAVMGELLFWGYNASLMAVDSGIDVIAEKDSHYYHIQVKTAMPRADDKYQFTIKNSAFKTNTKNNTYYIFLMRARTGNRFAIIPSSYLQTRLDLGIIRNSDKLSITISHNDKENHFLLNGNDNITPFIGRFDLIK